MMTYQVVRSGKGEEKIVASYEDTNDKQAQAYIDEEMTKPENAGFTFFIATIRDDRPDLTK